MPPALRWKRFLKLALAWDSVKFALDLVKEFFFAADKKYLRGYETSIYVRNVFHLTKLTWIMQAIIKLKMVSPVGKCPAVYLRYENFQ